MEKEIKDCGDCPFAGFTNESSIWKCFHPDAHLKQIAELNEELKTPEWCPLLKESITISIKK
jgi:hypothetical protein